MLNLNIGFEKCNYNKTFYERGSVTTARNESNNTFVEITVDDSQKLAQVYYNRDFGEFEVTRVIDYYDYINHLHCASQTTLIEKVKELINV